MTHHDPPSRRSHWQRVCRVEQRSIWEKNIVICWWTGKFRAGKLTCTRAFPAPQWGARLYRERTHRGKSEWRKRSENAAIAINFSVIGLLLMLLYPWNMYVVVPSQSVACAALLQESRRRRQQSSLCVLVYGRYSRDSWIFGLLITTNNSTPTVPCILYCRTVHRGIVATRSHVEAEILYLFNSWNIIFN